MDIVGLRNRLLVIAPLFAAVVWSLFYAQFTVDDAFIFFRYGKTLQLHHAWNWNPAGPPVEAYTSTIYGLLSVVPALLHVAPVLLFKLVGLGCVVFMVLLLKQAGDRQLPAAIAVALLLCQPYTWIHAYSCLETPLFMLLVLWMTLAVGHTEALGRWAAPTVVVTVAFALPLARPEGFVFGFIGLLLYMLGRRISMMEWLQIAVFALLAVAYFITRWHYFHYPLPNPFYVKVAHGSMGLFIENLNASKWLVVAIVAGIAMARSRKAQAMLATGLALMCLLYFPHELAMNYSNRFAFQMAFPLILSVVVTLPVAEAFSARMALVFLLGLFSFETEELYQQLIFYPYLHAAHIAVAKEIAPFAEGHSLMAGDMGSLPYYSDWMSYDIWGLCSNEVAHHGVTPEWIANAHPDLVMLYSPKPTGYNPHPLNEKIVAYMRLNGHYHEIGSVHWKEFYLVEYLRDDSVRAPDIQQALQRANAYNAGWTFHTRDVLKQKYLLDQIRNR